jgi:hypothetical protein
LAFGMSAATKSTPAFFKSEQEKRVTTKPINLRHD